MPWHVAKSIDILMFSNHVLFLFSDWVSHWGISHFNVCRDCFSLVGGRSYYKRNSTEFLIEFQVLEEFSKFSTFNKLGWDLIFFKWARYQMSCGFLVGFQKTRTQSRTRDGCHVSTLQVATWYLKIILLVDLKVNLRFYLQDKLS